MTKVQMILAALTVMCCWNTACTEQDDQGSKGILVLQLSDEDSKALGVDQPVSAINVYLRLRKHQPEISAGLRATVVLRNTGLQAVSLRDFGDSFVLELRTADGWPVDVPRAAPESLIHRSTRGAVPARVITIEPGQEYSIQLTVNRIFPIKRTSAEQGAPAHEPAVETGKKSTVPIPAGKYVLKLRAVLIPDTPASGGSARKLVSKPVEVCLGPRQANSQPDEC